MGAFSAFVIAAPATGSGKTMVSLALMAALRERGLRVQPFKVGPDYIDPAYHAAVCGRPSINLDAWLTSEDFVRETFAHHCRDADVAIVEGVMGLFDDGGFNSSTAAIAKLLALPVVLVADAWTASETAAATLLGCATFDPELAIAGAIASRTAGAGQFASLRAAFDRPDLPPLLGHLPMQEELQLPERHLGLVSVYERPLAVDWPSRASAAVVEHVDLARLLESTRCTRPDVARLQPAPGRTARIAVARDAAFCFYYEDNLRLLREAGADLQFFSPLRDEGLPEGAQALYLGGGFPETAAAELASNVAMKEAVRRFDGRVWGECGGLIYLGEHFTDLGGTCHAMAGRIPTSTEMRDSLQGFGYKEVSVARDTPLAQKGRILRGQEFHWTRYTNVPNLTQPAFRPHRGDPGYADGHTLATYVHVHFGFDRTLARDFVRSCGEPAG